MEDTNPPELCQVCARKVLTMIGLGAMGMVVLITRSTLSNFDSQVPIFEFDQYQDTVEVMESILVPTMC